MANKRDFRDLIVGCPASRAKVQAEYFDGAVYTDFEPMLRSVRKGSIVRVYRPFLLGGGKGSTQKQRKTWAERADAIKAKGGCLVSIDPPLKGAKLSMFASVEISNVARGKAGRTKRGRAPKVYTDEQLATIRKHWPRRHGVKVHDAVATINKAIAPRTVTAGWLYPNIK
jgi:hypothetical protein